jgi:hypothetical protein
MRVVACSSSPRTMPALAHAATKRELVLAVALGQRVQRLGLRLGARLRAE